MKGEIMTEKKTPSQEEAHKIMKLNQQSNKQFEMATIKQILNCLIEQNTINYKENKSPQTWAFILRRDDDTKSCGIRDAFQSSR